MIKARKFQAIGVLTVVTIVAGCQAFDGPSPIYGGRQVAPTYRQTGFEGDWLSTDGVAISRFTNGFFETIATDTGNKLAEGSYKQLDPNTVSILVTSLIRQTTTQVNCAMFSPTQLNCTSSAGQRFSLIKRSSGIG